MCNTKGPWSTETYDICGVCGGNGNCTTTVSTTITTDVSMTTEMSTSGTDPVVNGNGKKNSTLAIAIAVPVGFVVLVAIAILAFIIWRKKRAGKSDREVELVTEKETVTENPTVTKNSIVSKNSTNSIIGVKKLKDIVVLETLGGGQFSTVFKGEWLVFRMFFAH
jgi:hypothetical protein